jgi:hypothetical protein
MDRLYRLTRPKNVGVHRCTYTYCKRPCCVRVGEIMQVCNGHVQALRTRQPRECLSDRAHACVCRHHCTHVGCANPGQNNIMFWVRTEEEAAAVTQTLHLCKLVHAYTTAARAQQQLRY